MSKFNLCFSRNFIIFAHQHYNCTRNIACGNNRVYDCRSVFHTFNRLNITDRSLCSLLDTPEAAITWSLSQIITGKPLTLERTSAYCEANADNSPTGEYFLNITSPSVAVYISSGSPSRIRRVRRISFGITTRPRSSILLTIPVAFISKLP